MKITLTRLKRGLHVLPAPTYITKYLKYRHKSLELVRFKRKPVFKEVLLHQPDLNGSGGVVTFQGFFTELCDMITKHGDSFTVIDERAAMPEIDWAAIKRIGPKDYQVDPLIEFLNQGLTNSGVVHCCGGWGKTFAQAFTYAAWNQLNTILAIPLKQVFNQTFKKFQALFPDRHIGCVGDGKFDISKDITLTTFKSLPKCAIEKCELLMVDEIQECTGAGIQTALGGITPKRIFGFTATDDQLYNNADKLLTGLFGSRLIYVPYEEGLNIGAVVPGVVYFLPVNNTFVDGGDIGALMVKGIKRNKVRNGLIAKVCSSVPEGWATLTFVDHVEDHLVELYKHMPTGVKYLHRNSDKKAIGTFALTPKQQTKIIDEFTNNEFQHLIATDAFRAGVDIPHLRVVIQGAGGSSKVEVIQEALRGSRVLNEDYKKKLGLTEDKTHFVLIDFLDNHADALNNMALKRMEYYREQGWEIREVEGVNQIDWHHYPKKDKKV